MGIARWGVAVAVAIGYTNSHAVTHRDYPTLTPEAITTRAPAPGYHRIVLTWSAGGEDSVSWSKYRKPSYIRHVRCQWPAGTVTVDVPTEPPPPIVLYLFLGSWCTSMTRGEILTLHRNRLDWTTYVGSHYYPPGRPRVVVLYPTHSEKLVLYRSEPFDRAVLP